MADNLSFAFRSATGIYLKKGLSNPVDVLSNRLDVRTHLARSMEFSHNGKWLVYCDSERTICVDTHNGEEHFSHPYQRTTKIMFSPDDRLLVTYEPYVIYGSRDAEDGTKRVPDPNLRFFDMQNGTLLTTLIQKNAVNWAPQFTQDSQTFVLVENSEIHFYPASSPDRFTRKGVIRGVDGLKVSPGQDPILASFIPSKNETKMIALRNFHGDLAVIAQKATFNADKCDFKWNSKGYACLAIANVEVDKSNQSYYGTSNIFLLTKTGDSMTVPLDKKGPVHDVKWSPTGTQFTICYGYMPSKVAVFNLKANVVWDLGEGYRNELHYNPFGSILAVCGFGNISAGKILLLDTEQRDEIISLEVPDTIAFEWASDGQHFLTATTSPRLRVGNNYRFWNYVGKQLYEHQMAEFNSNGEKREIELAQIAFKPMPDVFSRFKIKKLSDKEKNELSQHKQAPRDVHPLNALKAVGIVKKNDVYVPPALRNKGAVTTAQNNRPNPTSAESKASTNNKPSQNAESKSPNNEVSEADKKIRTLKKKIKEIESLSEKVKNGESLEKNQMSKLEKYGELRKELDEIMATKG
ncbi:Eukaryotic translation initiation factor 2A [Aphelenchoides bicaudatus]|nr:Eukaryotic translation initiation factor 2A [Aphelenchoides bicaudatus]